jgi:hypothetical protein
MMVPENVNVTVFSVFIRRVYANEFHLFLAYCLFRLCRF